MYKVSILGATGYTGQELVKILSTHPDVKIVGLGSQSYVAQPYDTIYPNLRGYTMPCMSLSDDELLSQADIVFIALPHGHSSAFVEKALALGKRIIDLGADFRLKDPGEYTYWYKQEAPREEILKKAVYGIPELKAKDIKTAEILANPGCYPTTVLLGLAPLLQNKAINTGSIIVDSKSGVSGAGRGLSLGSHFCEVNEDFKAYSVPAHRHIPEMEQELSLLGQEKINITFTPHLIPITRGMLSTIYCKPLEKCSEDYLREMYLEFYKGKKFVRIVNKGEIPHTKWVIGSNYCDIGIFFEQRTGNIIIISVIDNLVKGASGQAIQNMNIMLGLDEGTGLPQWGMYP